MWRWVKDHAWLVGLALVGVLGLLWALFGKKSDKPKLDDLKKTLALEKKIIDEKAAAAKAAAQNGHAAAAAEIKARHQEAIDKMDEADRKKIEELENDPEALVDALLRASA